MNEPFSEGLVTSRDRADLAPGELQEAVGIEYEVGDTSRAWKIRGRSRFGAAGTGAIKGVAVCNFDNGSNTVIALSGTTLYRAAAGESGTFQTIATGVPGDTLTAAHANDNWYLSTGQDRNRVFASDGTVRYHGMVAQQEAPVCVAEAAGTLASASPTALGGNQFTNAANADDGSATTFASGTKSEPGTVTGSWGTWSSNTDANRYVSVRWALAGAQIIGSPGEENLDASAGYTVRVVIEKSEDDGATWSDLVRLTSTYARAPQTVQSPIAANSNLVKIRCSLVYTTGNTAATLRIYEIAIASGSITPFSTVDGLYYRISEYDESRGLESAPSPASALISLVAASSHNSVAITLPTPRNTNTTHWRIYRTTDGGADPSSMGLIGTALVDSDEYVDTFETDKDTLAQPLMPLLSVSPAAGGTLYFPIHTEPPAMQHMSYYEGSLVGVKYDSRELRYSYAGTPDSWPEIYTITSFPLPENDKLVLTVPCGESLIVFARQAVMALDGLPRVQSGLFAGGEPRRLGGQPGCVGVYAACEYSVSGEPRVAWVSPFGVHVTNGVTAQKITTDLNWNATVSQEHLSTAVLVWDHDRRILILSYDATGVGHNNRTLYFHMSDEHLKQTGPKITGPHYSGISCMSGALVDSTYRLYSGHKSDGYVYLENVGNTDASQSYSGTVLPMRVKSRRIYGDGEDFAVYRSSVYHTDGGSTTVQITTEMGRDENDTALVSDAVSVEGHRGTEYFVGLSGDWVEMTFLHTAASRIGLRSVRLRVRGMGVTGATLK